MTIIFGKCAQGLNSFGVAQECGNHAIRKISKLVRTFHQKECVGSDQPFIDL
jgi:hypothetical protein